ncbi:RNA polymerase sigma factor [Sphingomonas colocasiae]|uniref:RNA polymerase sigma factor n=1 Tax=Sphingomonas colocasiae TaxID=1848973 RepID=A0ABS7PRE7_9SPHN|nr:RNA polymerase sigma factor [Sphingomonas colocasiae]MBY8823245.1 RNA polymerase sigma factor [Sphingomonas colocasiae]
MRVRMNDAGQGPEDEAPAHAREAVSSLFAEHNGALVRFLRLKLSSDQEARDVAQEAYVRLLALEQPGTVSFLRAYLFRIATNIAIDRQRSVSLRNRVHADPVFDPGEDRLDPERRASAREQLEIVDTALRALPERTRTAFLLFRIDGVSMVEIARRLDVSERTARNLVTAAMVHCRKRLDEGRALIEGDEA